MLLEGIYSSQDAMELASSYIAALHIFGTLGGNRYAGSFLISFNQWNLRAFVSVHQCYGKGFTGQAFMS